MSEYNHHEYIKFIFEKYTKSELFYKKIFEKSSDVHNFLDVYDDMNVYPVFPRPIIMPLKRKDETYQLTLNPNSKLSIKSEKDDKVSEEMDKKIKEFAKYNEEMGKLKNTDKIRRYFDYEIRDEIKKKIKFSKITNAWVKMYELLSTYSIVENIKTDTINSFHICEHPGAFIFALQDYIKKRTNKKHDFVFQSLKPTDNPEIFKADKYLLDKFSDKLDYGKGSGDITDVENLKFYRNKYKNRKFDIITSDCGLNCSDDFTEQENILEKVYLGAFVCAIGLSTAGTTYISKLFSFKYTKTKELLQMMCLFYESVDVVRLLTTKSASGEIYIVCKNYNYSGNIDEVLDKLYAYLQNKILKSYLLESFNSQFESRIEKHHYLLSMRRIVSLDMLIFRYLNNKYISDNPEILSMTSELTEYYKKYFIIYIKLDE